MVNMVNDGKNEVWICPLRSKLETVLGLYDEDHSIIPVT